MGRHLLSLGRSGAAAAIASQTLCYPDTGILRTMVFANSGSPDKRKESAIQLGQHRRVIDGVHQLHA